MQTDTRTTSGTAIKLCLIYTKPRNTLKKYIRHLAVNPQPPLPGATSL